MYLCVCVHTSAVTHRGGSPPNMSLATEMQSSTRAGELFTAEPFVQPRLLFQKEKNLALMTSFSLVILLVPTLHYALILRYWGWTTVYTLGGAQFSP